MTQDTYTVVSVLDEYTGEVITDVHVVMSNDEADYKHNIQLAVFDLEMHYPRAEIVEVEYQRV